MLRRWLTGRSEPFHRCKRSPYKICRSALPTYMINVFKLPFGICDAIEKHTRKLWWGGGNGRRKTQWIPWEVLVRPKSYGGLGFRNLRLFNQALLVHQAMHLINYPESLCSHVLKAKYFPQGNLLDMAPAGDASPTWRSIEFGIELLKLGVVRRIGDGESTCIRRDNWIPRQPNPKPSGTIRSCRLRRVSQLMRSGSNDWDQGMLRRFFYPWDVEDILKIKLPAFKSPD
jgi:hypothetical protein